MNEILIERVRDQSETIKKLSMTVGELREKIDAALSKGKDDGKQEEEVGREQTGGQASVRQDVERGRSVSEGGKEKSEEAAIERRPSAGAERDTVDEKTEELGLELGQALPTD
jgi:FtsZ-binding cell division protein ZapB